ncbi:hypothetical protein D3C71_1548000 [compost metagenome]
MLAVSSPKSPLSKKLRKSPGSTTVSVPRPISAYGAAEKFSFPVSIVMLPVPLEATVLPTVTPSPASRSIGSKSGVNSTSSDLADS